MTEAKKPEPNGTTKGGYRVVSLLATPFGTHAHECQRCGALISDANIHDEWHEAQL